MSNIESQIKAVILSHTEATVREVRAIYASVFGESAAPAESTSPAPRSRPARKPAAKAPAKAATPKAKPATKSTHSAAPAPGQKRDPKALIELQEVLFKYVKANSGQRIEQISKGTGRATKELRLPMKKLIANKQVKAAGEKRATTYTAV